MPVQEILISHHSHTDIGYTHEQPVVWELHARYIQEALDRVEESIDWPAGAQFKWTCEVTAPVLHWMRSADPKDLERFSRHAREGRIEVMALFCNLTPLYDLEELHRALLPVARLRRELGIPIRTAMNSDVNGLPWPLVDLLLDSGVTGLTMAINEHMGGAPFNRPNAFRWVGPSGRSIIAYNGLHYGYLQGLGLGEQTVEEAHPRIVEWLEATEALRDTPILYVQNTRYDFWDNNGPQEKLAPFVRAWNEAGLTPRLRLVTPAEAIRRLMELPERLLPEHRGDWHDYWNFGAGSSVEPLRINRRSRRFLYDACAVAALHGLRERRQQELTEEAWTQLMLFDEHTWGAWCSISEPDSEFTRAQWAFKEDYGNRAAALSQFVRRRAVADVAKQVDSRLEGPAVLAYNPHPRAMTRRLRIPRDWNHANLSTTLPHQHVFDVPWRRNAPFLVTDAVEIPPLGWRVVPIAEAGEAESGISWDDQNYVLHTPHYEIGLDPARQGIRSWKDVATGREFVDADGLYRFGQVIFEACTAPRPWDAFWAGGWKSEWPAMRIGGAPASPVTVIREPGSLCLSQRVRVPEFPEMTWRLRVFDDLPGAAIEIEGRFPDRARPEALYLCFPLRGGDAAQQGKGTRWRAWYTAAGQRVLYDGEQIPGSCRDYVTTDTWAYMEPTLTPEFGMQIVCPDNPLLAFGGFHFGRRLRSIPDEAPPWMLAWVANTYWQTNFRAAQPGPFRQRFVLIPHPAGAKDEALHDAADLVLHEPILHPIPRAQSGSVPPQGETLRLQLGACRLSGIRAAEDGDGIVLTMYNPSDAVQNVQIASAWLKIQRAWVCDAVESKREELPCVDGSIRLTIPPRTPRTVRLRRLLG